MKIYDEYVLKEMKRVKSIDLEDALDSYPEEEKGDKAEVQILADECSYIISGYHEEGHVLYDCLNRAKEILKETEYGKVVPLWSGTLQPKYSKAQIQESKDIVNEYRRLQNLMKRLNNKGVFGEW